MLSPEYLFRLAEGAEDIAAQLHAEIVKKIVERIVIRLERGEKQLLTAVDKWQIETLQDAGYLRQDIQKELAKLTKTQLKEIRQAFEDAGIKSYNYDSNVYKNAEIAVTALRESPQYIRLLQAGYERTAGEWRNFTGTFADQAQKLFISECGRAYHLVSTGATSYSQAIADAVEKIATEGVTITYPSGHTDTVETATARAVRTGVAQACGEITEARLKDMNWDIILVSAHLGARLGDGQEDYTNHYWWQGKFYSYSGNDKRFPPFEVCGVGDVQGLCGANCRHSYGAGDGINNPYEEYDKAENIKRYEIEQRQRTLERRIRKTKRECMGLKQGVDSATDGATKDTIQDKYNKKSMLLRKQVEEYNNYCKDNDLKRRSERLQIAKWDREQTKAVDKAINEEYGKRLRSIGAQSTDINTYQKFDSAREKNTGEYYLLDGYKNAVASGEISPLVGFDIYKQTAQEIREKLVGVVTSNGIKINGFTTHFINRIIGQTSEAHKGLRAGTPIGDVYDALTNPESISDVYERGEDLRQQFIGEKAETVISVKDKLLIQANRRRNKK